MLISDVLTAKGHEVASLLADSRVADALRLFADRHIGAVVIDDRWQHLQGLFTERDLVRLLARQGADVLQVPLGAVMTRAVITCRKQDRIETVLAAMTQNRVRHLPVLDGDRLAGIVSIGDLVKYRLDEKALEADVLRDIARMHPGAAGSSLAPGHAA